MRPEAPLPLPVSGLHQRRKVLCYCRRFLPHRVGQTAVIAAASDSPSAHYSAYQGLGCDGSRIKLCTPDAFLHRSSSSSFRHLVVDPQGTLGPDGVYVGPKATSGIDWLSLSTWWCLEHLRTKMEENFLIPPWIQKQRH